MDDYIESAKALTSSLGVRLLDYLKVETMEDLDDAWMDFETKHFENNDPHDMYYVPVRRRRSPDWLQWCRKERLKNPLLKCQEK